MSELTHLRCFVHPLREAAACCPRCGQFYCRECITEHEDQVICASCLRRLAGETGEQPRRLAFMRRTAQCALGLLIGWFFFYMLGSSLLRLPSSFHDGTIWTESTSQDSP